MTPYPLAWPDTLPRTKTKATARFKTTLAGAMRNVREELNRFANDSGKRVTELVISSNVTLGVDRPADAGVAVWFVWDGMQVSIAVDRYERVEWNLQAIFHILEARRTEMRHGGLEITRATFKGFLALPAPPKKMWREVMNFGPNQMVTKEDLERVYREMAKQAHPDMGGSADAMAKINRTRVEALAEIGG